MKISSIVSLTLASYVVATDTVTASPNYSYSVPIDMSVIEDNLRTATDTRLVMLVSEFLQAKGTSALISLASVYGSDFLKGTLTDIESLAINVATVSGNNDYKNSVVTASTQSTAVSYSAAPSSSTVAVSSTSVASSSTSVSSSSSVPSVSTVASSSSLASSSSAAALSASAATTVTTAKASTLSSSSAASASSGANSTNDAIAFAAAKSQYLYAGLAACGLALL